MHVVVDAFAVRPGSAAITLENLLKGWVELGVDDRITVVSSGPPEFQLPASVECHELSAPIGGAAGSLWMRSVGVRRAARDLDADGVVSGVTASAFLGASCPHGVILYDLRHELRPHQFSRARRIARKASYAWSFRNTDGIYCISNRTRDDLMRLHPRSGPLAVLARYGADHVDAWPASGWTGAPYALAFGQFANKNVSVVLDAWARFCQTDNVMTLRLVGMGRVDREAATRKVTDLEVADRVELMPWLDDAAFIDVFTGASLVVFPSDFEGFGLPAVEALRRRIPLVVSDDPALGEVTGGYAAVAASIEPDAIARAMRQALTLGDAELDAGFEHTEQFRWSQMARAIRESLLASGAAGG